MTYHIYIGELKEIEEEDDEDYFGYTVPVVNCDSNLKLLEPTNCRASAFEIWRQFAKEVGLEDYFFGPTGVMTDSPGYHTLTDNDLKIINTSIQLYAINPACHHFNMDRLFWLSFWYGWALKNCKKPVILNN